jgi:hypothetical protein
LIGKIQHKTASLAKTLRFRPRVSRESRGRFVRFTETKWPKAGPARLARLFFCINYTPELGYPSLAGPPRSESVGKHAFLQPTRGRLGEFLRGCLGHWRVPCSVTVLCSRRIDIDVQVVLFPRLLLISLSIVIRLDVTSRRSA